MYKMLIVDDEELIRRGLLKKIGWKNYGFEVVGDAGNADEALRLVETLQPDLLITDIRMPGKNGLELIAECRNRNPEMLIVILSAYDDFSYAQDALFYGVAGYLLKPVKKEELEIIMRKVLQNLQEREIAENISASKYSRFSDDSADIVSRAKRYVLANYQNKLTLESVAPECFTNPTYLSNVFKVKTGCNFVDYVTKLKIQKASQLLRYSDFKVRDVAIQSGFDDYTYFCKVFKKMTGETPLQYRCRMRERKQ